MKNLLYGTLFLALVGITFSANAKEIVINSYDVTMTSDCGDDLHFIGPVVSFGNNNSNNFSIRAKLIDVKTRKQINYNEIKSFRFIISSIQQKLIIQDTY